MIVTPLIRRSASFAYAGVRTPFAVLESRLPESSRVRTGLHTALQTIDSSVEQLLHEPGGESRARLTRSLDAALWEDSDAERDAIADAVRERQPNVGELADPELDVAEVQAQLQAKHAVEAREEAKQAPGGPTEPSGR